MARVAMNVLPHEPGLGLASEEDVLTLEAGVVCLSRPSGLLKPRLLAHGALTSDLHLHQTSHP